MAHDLDGHINAVLELNLSQRHRDHRGARMGRGSAELPRRASTSYWPTREATTHLASRRILPSQPSPADPSRSTYPGCLIHLRYLGVMVHLPGSSLGAASFLRALRHRQGQLARCHRLRKLLHWVQICRGCVARVESQRYCVLHVACSKLQIGAPGVNLSKRSGGRA